MRTYLIMLLTILFAFSAVFAGGESEGGSERAYVTIGTGGVTGVYYPVGGAISRIVNQQSDLYNIKATVESTGGSVFNINTVLNGGLEFGIAQSDRQFQAINGMAEWAEAGPQEDLRSVFSLHAESVTLVASTDSGITGITDLVGKRVNLGNVGSGQLQNARDLLEVYSIAESDLQAEFVRAADAPSLLQDGRLDAFFYTVGHPSGAITEATNGRIAVRIVDIVGQEVANLVEALPYYSASVIPASYYPNAANTADTQTVGVVATLVTNAELSDDIVYAVTKVVIEDLDSFRALHPALNLWSPESMFGGLSAPLHPGALRYYDEVGIAVPANLR